MATTNNRGDNESPWNIPRLILTPPRTSPLDVNTFFQSLPLPHNNPFTLSATFTSLLSTNVANVISITIIYPPHSQTLFLYSGLPSISSCQSTTDPLYLSIFFCTPSVCLETSNSILNADTVSARSPGRSFTLMVINVEVVINVELW